MATNFSNYHIRHRSADTVEKVARTVLSGRAYITNLWGDWISLYDDQTGQNPAELHRVAGLLSAGLGCPVFGFLVHESDVLEYAIYDQGNLRDEFSSKPDHAGAIATSRRARLAGQPEVIKQYAAGAKIDEIKRLLTGSVTMGPDDSQFKKKMMDQIRGTTPESMGQMLNVAAQQLGQLPPDILRETLGRAGMPLDNPIVASMMQNPAAFLQQMAANPTALQQMVQSVGSMSEEALDKGMETANIPAEVRLLELGKMLGVQPKRICLNFATIEKNGDGGDYRQI